MATEERHPLAFSFSDLLAAGILDCPEARPSNLDNPIHCLFHRSLFLGITNKEYDALVPALRLASLLITEVHCLEWWASVFHGCLTGIEKCALARGRRALVLHPIHNIQPEHIDAVRHEFRQLSNNISFEFQQPDEQAYAYGCQKRSRVSPSLNIIQLSRKFVDVIAAGIYASAPLCQQLRFSFFFAINLVHEIAHAFYSSRPVFSAIEPFYLPDVWHGWCDNELGGSWEFFTFGCKIQPMAIEGGGLNSGGEACTYGLQSFHLGVKSGMDTIHGAIPMSYINKLMSKSEWEHIAIHGLDALKCPVAKITALDIAVESEWPNCNAATGSSKG